MERDLYCLKYLKKSRNTWHYSHFLVFFSVLPPAVPVGLQLAPSTVIPSYYGVYSTAWIRERTVLGEFCGQRRTLQQIDFTKHNSWMWEVSMSKNNTPYLVSFFKRFLNLLLTVGSFFVYCCNVFKLIWCITVRQQIMHFLRFLVCFELIILIGQNLTRQ